MTTTPTPDSLKALFNLLNLPALVSELNKTPAKYPLFLARSEAQWERRYGDAGVDIFNHLHPQQGDLITTRFLLTCSVVEIAQSSANSSSSSISCKSHSVSGRCSTGHVDRNKNMQKTFRRLVSRRDGKCVATGVTSNLKAAHIVPLENSELIRRDQLFSPENGVLLRSDLEDDYDRHMWIFNINGMVEVLYQNWPHRATIKTIRFGSDRPPSGEMINLHNDMAKDKAKHHCPNCWKYVGETNIEEHQIGSCENINL